MFKTPQKRQVKGLKLFQRSQFRWEVYMEQYRFKTCHQWPLQPERMEQAQQHLSTLFQLEQEAQTLRSSPSQIQRIMTLQFVLGVNKLRFQM